MQDCFQLEFFFLLRYLMDILFDPLGKSLPCMAPHHVFFQI